tara:strand:- start:1398 stop:1949 length:552 start_codon:yes stop_codon:yes gene_type:complete
MFWNQKKKENPTSELNEKSEQKTPYSEKSCWIYLSEKYKEILFVPIGIMTEWTFRELDNVIVKEWPLKIGELQKCVNITLDNFKQNVTEIENNNDNWFSFKNSKAKSQRSFNEDYIQFQLKTDFSREYADGEVERFNVKSSPRPWDKDRHYIIGTAHLVDTDIAQLILDINKDCQKIRNNNCA